MAQSKLKRLPDAAVTSSVAQVIKQHKSKRMMLFGLRNLAELCSVGNVKYKENSAAALSEHIVPAIRASIDAYADDEDVVVACVKILYGISMDLLDTPEQMFVEKLKADGGIDAIVSVLKGAATYTDEEIVTLSLAYLANINRLGLKVDPVVFAGPLVLSVRKKTTPATCAKIFTTLSGILDSPGVLAAISDKNAADKVLDVLSNSTPSDEAILMVEAGMVLLQKLAQSQRLSSNNMNDIIKTMDLYKSRKGVVDRGSAVLGSMLGPDELKKCLDALAKSKPGSNERAAALTMLSSMSYISAYADAVVKSGGIPLLCDAIKASAADIKKGSKEDQLIRGLSGATKMLGKIAANPANTEAVLAAGGVDALAAALESTRELPASFSLICDALVPLCRKEATALRLMSEGHLSVIVETLDKTSKQHDVATSAVTLLTVLMSHDPISEALYSIQATKTISQCLSMHETDLPYQSECIGCLAKLSRHAKSFSEVEKGHANLLSCMQKNGAENELLATAGLDLIQRFLAIADSLKPLQKGDTASAVLKLMLAHQESSTVQFTGLSLLESIATEDDVNRGLEDLGKSTQAARTTPEKAYASLAAVNGLSQVSRLKSTFEQRNANKTVMNAILGWVEGAQFPEQQKIVKAAARCIESLNMGSSANMDPFIGELLAACTLPSVKALHDKQNPLDHNLLDLLRCSRNLLSKRQLDPASIPGLVDAIMKVSWKYPDVRRVQIKCIDMLAELATMQDAGRYMVDSGAMKAIVSYMQKVIIYEDVQAAGLRFLGSAIKHDPSLIEPIKHSGAVELCKMIRGSHSQSQTVKGLLPPVATALMPSEFMDADIKKHIDAMKAAIENSDLAALSAATAALGGQLGTATGCRAAIQNRVGHILQHAAGFAARQSHSEAAEVATELSLVAKALAENRAGAEHLARCGGVEMLLSLLTIIDDKSVPDSQAKRDGIESNLLAQKYLMKATKYKRQAEDVTLGKRQVAMFCMLAEEYPEDTRIGGAAAQAMAALPTSQLTKSPEFAKAVARYIAQLNSPDERQAASGARCMAGLLEGVGDEIIAQIQREKGISALFNALDAHGQNKEIRHDVLNALEALAKNRNLVKIVKDDAGDVNVKDTILVLCNALRSSVDDADAAIAIVKLLNELTTKDDKELFASIGMAELAGELMGKHADNKELLNALGVLLGKAGAGELIESLIQQILHVVTTKPADWQRQAEALLIRLSVFLPSEVDNPDKTFAQSKALCSQLAQVVQSERDDGALLSSIALVSRRLASRFESTPDSPYGAIALEGALAPAIAAVLASDAKANQNRNFVLNGYHALAQTTTNSAAHPGMIRTVAKTKLLPSSYKALRKNQADAEVTASILAFHAACSSDPEGMKLLISSYPKIDARSAEEQIAGETLAAMRMFRSNGNCVAAGGALLGNLFAAYPNLMTPGTLKELGVLAAETPQGFTAMMNSMAKLVQEGHASMLEAEIGSIDGRFRALYDNKSTVMIQKAHMAIAFANLAQVLAEANEMEALKKINAEDLLATILEDFSDNPEVVAAVLKALRAMADADSDVNAKIARMFPAIICGEAAAVINGSPILQALALELFYTLGCNEGNGRLMTAVPTFGELIADMEQAAGKLGPSEANAMKKLIDNVKNVVSQDAPHSLTLKEIHNRWTSRKAAGETLELSESEVVVQQFDVLCDYTDEYSRAKLNDLEAELGSEFRYGCLCFSLLHEYPSNTMFCLEKGEHGLMLQAMKSQKVEIVAQCAIVAARDLCAHPDGASAFSNSSGCPEITVDLVRRGNETSLSVEEGDDLMVPRLELMERCATHRQYYNGTDAIPVLIAVWDRCDSGDFSTATLRCVFRAMRKIVNETWVKPILANQVPKRLIKVVEKVDQDIVLLPDVLFLIGALATVAEIKTLIGEQRGIEACLELIQRCLKNTNDDCSAVLTNGCLALANITIGHGPNIAKFCAAKGVELNVTVLYSAMKEQLLYEVANAASVLMCNLCYRRDDIKEIFGGKEGPRSVSESIKKYDGSDSKSAFRCVSSMLKAIGNLALYTPNVDTFLQENVEATFAHLYSNSEFLPDELLEVSLRTMSNLVLENTDEYMEKFGVVLLPLLTMLASTSRESVRMLALTFEVLGNLCRLPSNAKTFAENGGIDITLKIVNTYADPRVSAAAIHVLGVQTTYPESIGKLISAGVFTFLISLFQQQATTDEQSAEVSIAGLRCLRRLLLNRPSAEAFARAGGPASIIQLMQVCPELSLVQLDCQKALIALLTLVPPPQPIQRAKDEEWDASVPDEGVLSLVNRLERPPSPRSWESISLDVDMIRRLIANICAALLSEGHEKQRKLQKCGLGLLAYFACEKIPKTVEAFYAGQYHFVVRQAFQNFPKDYDIVRCCCTIIANVSYVSDREDYRVVAKDKQLERAMDQTLAPLPKKPPGLRDYCILTQKLLFAKERSTKGFESLAEWEYDLSLTGWNEDPYPNGVQDLPPEVKKMLREGSRFKAVTDPKTRVPFWWKSSQDLTQLQWRFSDDTTAPYNHQVPIGRVRGISKGLASNVLDGAARQDRRIDSKNTLVVQGPPTEEFPNGLELNIKTKTKKEREALWELFTEWKDAATYGF